MELSLESAKLKHEVSLNLFSKMKHQAIDQSAQALADFAMAQPQAPHPNLGKSLDIRI